MIRGITPIDTAFELMGAHQAQVLVHSVFINSLAGKVLFALGFILSLRAGLEQHNFRPVYIFMALFFSLWILFVLPQAKAVVPVSAMERAGYTGLTAADILRKNGYEELTVNPVLDTFSRMLDALITSMTAVLDRGREGKAYLREPFLFVKLSLLTSRIISEGIKDPVLEEDLARFYQDHYWAALKSFGDTYRIQKANSEHVPMAWPGADEVVAIYREEGLSRWQALLERLYGRCDKDKAFSRLFELFYDGKVDKAAVVKSLLQREMELKPGRYTVFSYAGDRHRIHITAPAHGPELTDVIAFLPFIHGAVLFLVWITLPAWLGSALLLRRLELLAGFLVLLLGVKAWTLIWAVLDKSSLVWFAVSGMRGQVLMWEAPAVNRVLAVAALVLPAVVTGWIVLSWQNRRSL